MKHFFRPLHNETLRPDEHDAIRKTLQEAMEAHPYTAAQKNKTSHIFFLTPLFTHLTTRPMIATMFLALLVALGGGTAAAAENAAPGDALYPFKIHINESVRGAIAVSTDAEADWQSTRAVRRLEEAADLAAKGTLNTETREKLRAKFSIHQEKAERLLADLRAKGKTEAAAAVSAKMETNLSAYNEILTTLKRSRPASADLLEAIRSEVRSESEEIALTRAKVEAGVGEKTASAAKGKMNAAENKIKEVRKYIERKKTQVDASATAQARVQITLAEEKLASGKLNLENEQYAKAFLDFTEAHMTAERAKLTLKTIDKLNISLFSNTVAEKNDSIETEDSDETEKKTEKNNEKEEKNKKSEGKLEVKNAAAISLPGNTEVRINEESSLEIKKENKSR